MGCFLHPIYFFRISSFYLFRISSLKNKTVICHLSLTNNTIYSKYQYPIYHNAHYSFIKHRVTESQSFIILSVSSYNLIFSSVTLCLCVQI